MRSLPDIQKRGRWTSKSSVRRYEKAASLVQQLQRVPDALLRKAVSLEATLLRALLPRLSSASPPCPRASAAS